MLFKALVDVSKRVSATTRKKEKASLLAECLKRGQGQEIALAATYLSGQIPQGSLGLGWAILQKALGNLGMRPRPLSLPEVNRSFDEIAQSKGAGSVERKVQAIQTMFEANRK